MPTAIDLKAGFCSMCRRGSHVMCRSSVCACDSSKGHPNRSSNGAPSTALPASPDRSAPRPPPASLTAPVFERVREDPPVTARKARTSTADSILPILEDIARVGDRSWWRVGLFPKRQQAGAARTAVVKRLGEDVKGWEFKAAKVTAGPGESALYARRVDR